MNGQALMVIVTISVITVFLRTLPFIALEKLRRNNYRRYLGRVMPVGIMTQLVGYSLKDTDFTAAPYGIPELVIMVCSGLIYWRTRASLLSIGAGLLAYVALQSLVF